MQRRTVISPISRAFAPLLHIGALPCVRRLVTSQFASQNNLSMPQVPESLVDVARIEPVTTCLQSAIGQLRRSVTERSRINPGVPSIEEMQKQVRYGASTSRCLAPKHNIPMDGANSIHPRHGNVGAIRRADAEGGSPNPMFYGSVLLALARSARSCKTTLFSA